MINNELQHPQQIHPQQTDTLCSKCHALNNKSSEDFPIAFVQQDKILYPMQHDGRIIISNMRINALFARTIIYLNIRELDISYNNISHLPDILSLEKLNCSSCQLTKLPDLPKLKELNCSNNKIRQIPEYEYLSHLICNKNPITDICIKTLVYLEAYNCPLLVLHYLPIGTYSSSSKVIIDWISQKCHPSIYDKLAASNIGMILPYILSKDDPTLYIVKG